MNKQILFLHGGGTGNKDRMNYLKEPLSKRGIDLLSFNFMGHSAKKEEMDRSSLEHRVNEARTEIEKLKLIEPLSICGSSMGGHIAIKLLEKYTVQNLILICPGVYDLAAYSVAFGSGFTDIIRKPDSWKKSDAFALLQRFKGNALIVIGENDTVIPKEVVPLLEKNLVQARHKEVVVIPGAPHQIHSWIAEHESWRDIMLKKMSALFE